MNESENPYQFRSVASELQQEVQLSGDRFLRIVLLHGCGMLLGVLATLIYDGLSPTSIHNEFKDPAIWVAVFSGALPFGAFSVYFRRPRAGSVRLWCIGMLTVICAVFVGRFVFGLLNLSLEMLTSLFSLACVFGMTSVVVFLLDGAARKTVTTSHASVESPENSDEP